MKRLRFWLILLACVLLAGFLLVHWVIRSAWLHEQIRARIVLEAEKATGGKVDLARFHFDPDRWLATAEGFTLHGTEPDGEAPLFKAQRVQVGLKVLSFLRQEVDIRALVITQPQVNLIIDKQGRNNWPGPKRDAAGNPMEKLLALAVDDFIAREGTFLYGDARLPIDLAAKDLQLRLAFTATPNPHYQGDVRATLPSLLWHGRNTGPADLNATLGIYSDSVSFQPLHLVSRGAAVTLEGTLRDWSKLEWATKIEASGPLQSFEPWVGEKLGTGTVRFSGTAKGLAATTYELAGTAQGDQLRPVALPPNAAPLQASTKVKLAGGTGLPLATQLSDVRLQSRDLRLDGAVAITPAGLTYKGLAKDLNPRALLPPSLSSKLPYPILLTGPVDLAGSPAAGWRGKADLTVTPGPGAPALSGNLHATFDTAKQQYALRDSNLETASTKVYVDGGIRGTTVDAGFRTRVETTNLEEIFRLTGLHGEAFPVAINPGGFARFEGTAANANGTAVDGRVEAKNVTLRGQLVQSVDATVHVEANQLKMQDLSAALDGSVVKGSLSVPLSNWKLNESGALLATLSTEKISMQQVEKIVGQKLPIQGDASVTANLTGTPRKPQGTAQVRMVKPIVQGQQLDQLAMTVRLLDEAILVEGLEAKRGAARLTGFGKYKPDAGQWTRGEASLTWEVAGLNISEFRQVLEWREAATGRLAFSGQSSGRTDFAKSGIDALQLATLKVNGRLDDLSLEGRSMGALQLAGETRDSQLDVRLSGNLAGSPVNGTARLGLRRGYPLEAQLQVGTIPFALLRDLRAGSARRDPFPFDGSFSASVRLSGPALELDQWRADLEVPQVEVRPTRQPRLTLSRANQAGSAEDFVLRNSGPIQLSLEGRSITIKKAQFVAKDTNLSASGTFSLADRRPWDLHVIGDLNLVGIKTFLPELATGGTATLDANVKGVLADPQVFGRLDLHDASLYLENLPTGLDKVNGRVLFDRQRATIENKLTAETGGGALGLSGFVDFGQEEAFYRLLGSAANVRIRYPEGVSTQADAALTLTGTAKNSILGGNISVLRSGFIQKTDLGSFLSESSRSAAEVPSANSFLNNMQLDVKLRTAPNTQFTTSLTSDLQAEGNLQVRGTAAKPIVLGRISVNAGSINFFGNTYTIKRGEISFYNPTRIEPVLDLDLETRVRAVTVGINFTGPVSKLNTSYRSDPPLQSNEIIALLTVGRSPDSRSYATSGNTRGSLFDTGANTLLGNAISAPIASQLQRFFGVSRIKIDPFISGLEGIPQARVTLEQQVSKDVTLTFVTNLNRSQQQIVRLEWNVSREWSLIALRDENGSFGMDFQFRKQFK